MITRTDDLGDVILTLPLAVEIKRRLPDVELAFLVRPYISHLVDRIREIDTTFTLPASGKGSAIFKEYKPDAIIFAHPDFRLALDAVRSRIDVRVGPGYSWYSGLFTRWIYDRRRRWGSHEAEFELGMLEPLFDGPFELTMPELPPMEEAIAEADAFRREIGIDGRYLIIHPIGYDDLPGYPIECYAEIGRTLLDEHPDLSIIITAVKDEHEEAARLMSEIDRPGRVGVSETLSPNGVSELVRGASCFISSSSDGVHLAALVRTPVVALFPGNPPDWPQRRGPIGESVTTLIPHRNEPLPPGGARGHNPESVIARIRPERVIDAVRGAL